MLWPGLYGSFHLDDFPNLSGLPAPDQGFTAALNYLLNPPVGGSGRPIAYVSFLLQAEHWPGNPFPFKLVNLCLHLVNGAFVSVLTFLVGKAVFSENVRPAFLAILGMSAGFVWVILPMNLSTVFYVVQRMTLLSAFMTLVALVGYTYLRVRYDVWTKREYLIAIFAVGIGYMGVFAKETAVLTGLLILALEYSIFSRSKSPLSRPWKLVFLVLPVVLVFGYLLLAGRILGEYSYRAFSFQERLFSESVILLDYLGKILAPTNARINLYNDGYPFQDVSGNVFLVGSAILALAVLVWLALRRKNGLLSLGILFFLAGHLLESTVIPLELYFEHRNYLPSVGLMVALLLGFGGWLVELRQSHRLRSTAVLVLLVAWVGWLGVVSAIESRVWGDPRAFSVAAFTERPGSLRARQEIGRYLMRTGDYMGAANVLYSIDTEFGRYAGTYAQLFLLKCYEPNVPLPTIEALGSIFGTAKFDRGVGPALQEIWRMKRSKGNHCSSVANATLLSVIDALLENPVYRNRNNMLVLKSLVLADQGQWISAGEAIERIPRNRISIEELILGARYFGHAGEVDKAVDLLDVAERRISGPIEGIVHRENIERVRSTIFDKESDTLNRSSGND